LPYGYSYKASCARSGSAVIYNFRHPGTLTLRAERRTPVYPYGNSGRQRVKVPRVCQVTNALSKSMFT